MAQLLVHLDDQLKRSLKTRLAREGKTLKQWVEEAAREYLGQPERPTLVIPPEVKTTPTPRPRPKSAPLPSLFPQARPQYNVEED
jgi:hypothetical protein